MTSWLRTCCSCWFSDTRTNVSPSMKEFLQKGNTREQYATFSSDDAIIPTHIGLPVTLVSSLVSQEKDPPSKSTQTTFEMVRVFRESEKVTQFTLLKCRDHNAPRGEFVGEFKDPTPETSGLAASYQLHTEYNNFQSGTLTLEYEGLRTRNNPTLNLTLTLKTKADSTLEETPTLSAVFKSAQNTEQFVLSFKRRDASEFPFFILTPKV